MRTIVLAKRRLPDGAVERALAVMCPDVNVIWLVTGKTLKRVFRERNVRRSVLPWEAAAHS